MKTIDGVNVLYQRGEQGLFYATSPDIPGLLCAAPNVPQLDKEVTQAIRDLRAVQGQIDRGEVNGILTVPGFRV
jgi:hypothetical protein